MKNRCVENVFYGLASIDKLPVAVENIALKTVEFYTQGVYERGTWDSEFALRLLARGARNAQKQISLLGAIGGNWRTRIECIRLWREAEYKMSRAVVDVLLGDIEYLEHYDATGAIYTIVGSGYERSGIINLLRPDAVAFAARSWMKGERSGPECGWILLSALEIEGFWGACTRKRRYKKLSRV